VRDGFIARSKTFHLAARREPPKLPDPDRISILPLAACRLPRLPMDDSSKVAREIHHSRERIEVEITPVPENPPAINVLSRDRSIGAKLLTRLSKRAAKSTDFGLTSDTYSGNLKGPTTPVVVLKGRGPSRGQSTSRVLYKGCRIYAVVAVVAADSASGERRLKVGKALIFISKPR